MSFELPCLNKGVPLAHFQSSRNMPVVKEQLKILQIEMQLKLAHILSRPLAFDLLRLFNSENN